MRAQLDSDLDWGQDTNRLSRRLLQNVCEPARVVVRFRPAILTVLIAGLAVESVSICPHYLAFFNVLAGGTANGPAILAGSNLDLGQDAKNLAAWLNAHHVSQVCLDYFGTADIGRLGVRGPSLPATWETGRRASLDCVGAISTNILYDAFSNPQQHAWLRALRPVARVGYSIYIYDLSRNPRVSSKRPSLVVPE